MARPVLNETIIIQRNMSRDRGVFNEAIADWQDWLTIAAHRRDVSAGERYRAAQVAAKISVRFTARHSVNTASITPSDRLIWRGQIHNITGVRETERGQYLEIDAVIAASRRAA